MKRSICLAVLAGIGMLAAQDPRGGGMPGSKPQRCDLKKAEKGIFCKNCVRLLDKPEIEEVEKEIKHKDNSDHQVISAEVCVKRFYRSGCHPDKQGFKPGTC